MALVWLPSGKFLINATLWRGKHEHNIPLEELIVLSGNGFCCVLKKNFSFETRLEPSYSTGVINFRLYKHPCQASTPRSLQPVQVENMKWLNVFFRYKTRQRTLYRVSSTNYCTELTTIWKNSSFYSYRTYIITFLLQIMKGCLWKKTLETSRGNPLNHWT